MITGKYISPDCTCLMQDTQMLRGSLYQTEHVESVSSVTAVPFSGCIVEIPQPVIVIFIKGSTCCCSSARCKRPSVVGRVAMCHRAAQIITPLTVYFPPSSLTTFWSSSCLREAWMSGNRPPMTELGLISVMCEVSQCVCVCR